MTMDLILSQGRIADRKDGTIEGALLTAQEIEKLTGVEKSVFGNPSSAVHDDWTVSLPAANDTLKGIQQAVDQSLQAGNFPVLVANTCSASLATLPVVAHRLPEAFVLWIDAHGDFNTPATTDSGYLGGMVVAGACGLWETGFGAGLKPSQVAIVGGRDIDGPEQKLIEEHRVSVLPPSKCSLANLRSIVGNHPLWVHIDWDVLEPGYIPADYSVPGGLLPQHIAEILTEFSVQIRGLEIAEFHVKSENEDTSGALAYIAQIVRPALRLEAVA